MPNYSRHRTRKFLYQVLYAYTFEKVNILDFKKSFYSGIFKSDIDEDYFNSMLDLILKNEEFLVRLIEKYAPKFDVKTMDLSMILPIFIGASEILFLPEKIPIKVSINESVEISKNYGDEGSKKIVNGVLNRIINDYEDIKKQLKDFKKDQNFVGFFKN